MNNELIIVTGWQVKTIFALLFLLIFVWASCGYPSDRIVVGGVDGLDPSRTEPACSVLLALSGGGARGLAVVGILRAFEEKNIRVQAIAGTSMGGIVGGLYACGYSPAQLTEFAITLDFNNLFSNAPSRRSMFLTRRQDRDRHLLSMRFDGFRPVIPQALTSGQRLTSMLTSMTTRAAYQAGGDFSRLPIPFKTISTDLVSGEEVILDRGSMADAMRATMAFPLAFTGLERGNQLLMDGGMVTPVPVQLVGTMSDSIDFVVAVNTASILLPREDLVSPVDIANQATTIMTADKLADELANADYVITPPLGEITSVNFASMDSIINIGYKAGLSAADSIIEAIEQNTTDNHYLINSVAVVGLTGAEQVTLDDRFEHRVMTRTDLVEVLKRTAVDLGLFRIQTVVSPVDTLTGDTLQVELSVDAARNFHRSEVVVSFHGNTVFDDSELTAKLFTADFNITAESLREGLDSIKELYYSRGFDLAYIRNLDIDYLQRRIAVDIDEAIIHRIDVTGNERTRDWWVLSYFTLKPGEPYSTSRANRGIANIYGTDLFNRVTVEVHPSDSGAVVTIGTEEKEYSQLRLGWHWHDEYQSEEYIEFLNDNVGGIGLQYLLHARYAQDRQDYFALLKTDRIVSTYLTAQIGVFHTRMQRQLYDADNSEDGTRQENKTGADLMVGQQIARLGTVSARMTIEEIEYEYLPTTAAERFGLRSLTIESLVEDFNRIPFPTTGRKHVFQIQFAGKYLGGDYQFTRFYSSLEGYFPFGRYINYHPRIALGISRSGLPPSEQFFLGGLHSFAGFRTFQLAGDKMFSLSNELRIRLPLRLYLTGRYDVGEVYVSSDQIKLRNLRHGAGAYLSLDSPIGPVEFGYGIADSDTDRLYLNIGLEF